MKSRTMHSIAPGALFSLGAAVSFAPAPGIPEGFTALFDGKL